MTKAEAEKNYRCWSAVATGEALYLIRRCDYFWGCAFMTPSFLPFTGNSTGLTFENSGATCDDYEKWKADNIIRPYRLVLQSGNMKIAIV